MKKRIEVSAELLVTVKFSMEAEETDSLNDTTNKARLTAERVAQAVIGDPQRGEVASAAIQRITAFTVKLV